MKRFLSVLLSVCMLIVMSSTAFAETHSITAPVNASIFTQDGTTIEQRPMDELDILIAAFRILSATCDHETPIWNSITGISGIEPLYNLDSEIIAFYLMFEPCGYAIVNNNIANPVIIEFSSGAYTELDNLIESTKSSGSQQHDSAKICYGGASNLFTLNEAMAYIASSNISSKSSHESVLRLNDIYTYMRDYNESEYSNHSSLRRYIIDHYPSANHNSQRELRTSYTAAELNEMYGIINWDNMPTNDSYYTWTIEGGANIHYGTTGEFAGVNGATNHCAATAAFNIIAYYAEYLDRPELFVNDDRIETFTAIHEEIGNGPVLFGGYNRGLSNYVASKGRTYHYESGGNFTSIKNGIESNHMSTILMTSSITSWHMVNAVGYRVYSAGAQYIRIVNGWENTARRFILSSNMVGSFTTWIT